MSETQREPEPRAEPVIEVQRLSFSYGPVPVLADANLSIAGGDFVCIVGPNGGGKTTLLRLILGLLTPTRGRVRVFGQTPGGGAAAHRVYAATRPSWIRSSRCVCSTWC